MALLTVMVLTAAACGGGSDGETLAGMKGFATTTTTTTTTTTVPPDPEAGNSRLTGLPVDGAIMNRPVVAVKIDNVDGRSTPQVGLELADVVYEVQVEGQVTRLLALYQTHDSAPVGPVRSARASEIPLLEELHTPLFTWHGANNILGPQVRASAIVPRSISDIPQFFYRDPSRPAPYNSFVTSTADIRSTAPEGSAGPEKQILTFATGDEAPSPRAVPANHVDIAFPIPFGSGGGGSPVAYDWRDGKWWRSQSGHPHTIISGEQISADNVIVRFVPAVDSGTVDKAGTRVPTAQVVGEGAAWVFTRGTMTDARWIKPDNTTPTRYVDADGKPILLTRGTTWISMPYGVEGSGYR